MWHQQQEQGSDWNDLRGAGMGGLWVYGIMYSFTGHE